MVEHANSLTSLSAHQVIEHMREGVMITDAYHRILAVNESFTRVTGYEPADIIGETPRLLKSGEHKPAFYLKMWTSIAKNGYWQGEIINRRKNGELYTEWLTISAIKNTQNDVTHYMGIFTDITKRKRAQETIRHMAYYDALTDLPNRAFFREQLRHALLQAEREGEMLGVLFLDLDRVKVINDTLGHDMGDRLLKGVAVRLRETLRESDIVARLGGDEFMILLPGIKKADEIFHLTEKIIAAIRPSFHFDNHELFTTASVGVSIFPTDGNDAGTLLKNADTAMYRAKRHGRNSFQLFDDTMKAEMQQQLRFENGMRHALENNEFIVYYQPQVDLATGEVIGMEALARWNHPELGILPPSAFMHWAEESGLIIPIGEHILRLACEQTKRWHDQGHHNIKVGVNISAKQLRQSNIIQTVEKVLTDTNLPANSLDLELTESVIMDIYGHSMDIPHTLKSMGIGFSIDDFGTGYSSLNYLKRLPVTTLKLDQSFVRDLTTNANDAAIANAVIGLGHGLNLNVLAEGVETEHQLNYLRELNCDQVQGFFFSQPLPPEIFETHLRQRKNLLNAGTLFQNQ